MRAASKIVHLSFAGHRSSAVDDAKYRFRPLYTTLVWTTEKRTEGEPNIHLLTTYISRLIPVRSPACCELHLRTTRIIFNSSWLKNR